MKVKAEVIEVLAPGTIVTIKGTTYIRMTDSSHLHVEGYLFNPEDGWWGHWSHLSLGNEEVEVSGESK